MFTTPILFLVYKNIPVTLRVFERLRQLRPTNLYIAADGPKCIEEEHECSSLRHQLIEMIDWDCNVHTLFRATNLGLKLAVSSALDWFFTFNESGIILEYDCLPDLSFFPYCSELLDRYSDDTRIFSISGNNILRSFHPPCSQASYFFSSFTPVWGWATWRRSWLLWRPLLIDYPVFLQMQILEQKLNFSHRAVRFWKSNFDDVYLKKNTTTWAFCFNYYQLLNSSLCIVPCQNLVKNLGFGPSATHSTYKRHPLSDLPLYSLDKIYHPKFITPSVLYDIKFAKLAGYVPIMQLPKVLFSKLKSIVKSILRYS